MHNKNVRRSVMIRYVLKSVYTYQYRNVINIITVLKR